MSAASAARRSAVASIGCWSNWDISPPRGHQPLPIGERCPSWRGLGVDEPVERAQAGRRPSAPSRAPAGDDQRAREQRVLVGHDGSGHGQSGVARRWNRSCSRVARSSSMRAGESGRTRSPDRGAAQHDRRLARGARSARGPPAARDRTRAAAASTSSTIGRGRDACRRARASPGP